MNTENMYDKITQAIMKDMAASRGEEWVMPWHKCDTTPRNAFTKKKYRGVNVLWLWSTAQHCGFSRHIWASYKQWQSLGAQVKPRSKGTAVVFYRPITKQVLNKTTGEYEDKVFYTLRSWTVFNIDQTQGCVEPEETKENLVKTIENAEAFVANTKAIVCTGQDSAYYAPLMDNIFMPQKELFVGTKTSTPTEAYYATLLHELIHWTGAEHRLNRIFGRKFGDRAYACEELVAELGSSFLCADLGISQTPRKDHAKYLNAWLSVLQDDNRAIFRAAREATIACDYLHKLQGHTAEEEDIEEAA